jgi:hypothetical protein
MSCLWSAGSQEAELQNKPWAGRCDTWTGVASKGCGLPNSLDLMTTKKLTINQLYDTWIYK